MTYVPQHGDIVVATFTVPYKRRGIAGYTKQRDVFGAVQRVTPKRVLIETLRMGFLSFSRVDVWVPRSSVALGSLEQHQRWQKASGDCNELARAMRDAYVGDAVPERDASDENVAP